MIKSKNIKISDVKLTSNAPFFSNKAISGKFQRRFTGIQYFELEFTANFMAQHIEEVKKFAIQTQFSKPFYFPLSYFSLYTGTVKDTLTSAQNANAGARIVTAGQFSGTLEAGTIIQFSNHSKLYQVTEDVKAGGQIKLFPNLRSQVQAGEIIKYRNIEGAFLITDEKREWTLQSLNKVKFNATESMP